ncbi:hypothetical protein NW768_009979 [Fusarium equiseti]|uniref:Uncharacterized protein n=1 Tax=Fusarium equiseti TaxID=61235 RepID=A0ABQ8R164_FUSEQ|nr:hypothetical protein NW768_009979 [Fusarium equiseti]
MSKPAWFYRLRSLARTRQAASGIPHWEYLNDDLPLEPEDYDEDLSELSSLSCDSDNGCEYDSYDECTRHDGDESDTSGGSCASGIDMDYYDMKKQHKERKRHFRELQKAQQGPKKEKAKPEFGPAEQENAVDEIKDAIARAQKKKKLEPLDLLGGKDFELYSLDHIKYCPDDAALTRCVDFYADEAFDHNAPLKSDRITASVSMDTKPICQVDQFTPKVSCGAITSRPAWFHRLQALVQQRKKEKGIHCDSDDDEPVPPIKPEEFDQDLSDYLSDPCVSDCEYETDAKGDKCCKKHGYGDIRSESSGGSYNPYGPDWEYYLLKEMRNERKEEIYARGGRQKVLKEQQEQEKKELEFELSYIEPIQEAIDKAQKRKKPAPLKHLSGKEFTLWSTDHVKHCPEEIAPTRYITFYSDDEWDDAKRDHPERKSKRLAGHIYILGSTVLDLGYFIPPKYPSTKTYPLPTPDENAKVEVQFIDDNHLTPKINPDPIFKKYGAPVPSDAPSMLFYYGEARIWAYEQRLRKQKESGEEKRERRRSASSE